MDERKLIAAAQRGDVPSFNQLVKIHQGIAFRTAFRVLGESEAAADATQDAFISAFKNIQTFRGGSFKAWLLRIVTNSCYDQLRAKHRRPAASLEALLAESDNVEFGINQTLAESPQEFAERRELGAMIQRGLQLLPTDQRVTVILADIEGFSYVEMAQITGTNIGTIKSRLSRGRAQLREFLIANAQVARPARPVPTLSPVGVGGVRV
jgi:RNA polymerase sigma-70 factor, ECF subfamily